MHNLKVIGLIMQPATSPESSITLAQVAKRSWPVLVAIGAVLLGLGFLIGYLPASAKHKDAQRTLQQQQRQNALTGYQNLLGSAAVDAIRGRYEPARQQMSQFFTSINDDLKRGAESNFIPAHREPLGPLLAQRDELITLLARNDPASAGRLIDLYLAYRDIINPPPQDHPAAQK